MHVPPTVLIRNRYMYPTLKFRFILVFFFSSRRCPCHVVAGPHQIPRPDDKSDQLGLAVLDEPAAPARFWDSMTDRFSASPILDSVSGRFDILVVVAQGGNALFSFLERRVEGRALRALGPPSEVVSASSGCATMVSTLLSGLVAEAPWSPDVCPVARHE